LDGREALCASLDAENRKEKFEEEKIVGKKGKTVAAPATPKPKSQRASLSVALLVLLVRY
jgi:hypothetical protein